MQKCNLEFSVLKFKKQTKYISFLYYVMGLSFASSILSIAAYNASKYYYFYYIHTYIYIYVYVYTLYIIYIMYMYIYTYLFF